MTSMHQEGAVESTDRQPVQPPVARLIPKTLQEHGRVRVDNYHWLRDRDSPQVIDYLCAENEYTDAMMTHTQALQDALFEEFKGRIKQTDMSVPYKKDDHI